jgi:citrate lyase beta subunit
VTLPFLLISVQQPALTARLMRSSAGLGAVVVLDLEDGLWDVVDPSRTAQLKAAAREHLAQLAAEQAEAWRDQQLGVRLNRLADSESAADLHVLGELGKAGVELACVLVTKVESSTELERWATQLSAHAVVYRSIVPIVETVAGLTNLESICAAARDLGGRWVVYGHYDYALDAGWWPFPDDRSAGYWRHVESIIQRVEAAGISYVHPPFFRLKRLDEFAGLVERLARTCHRPFGVLTFGAQQALIVVGHAPHRQPAAETLVSSDHGNPSQYARELIDAYLANRRSSMSFAIDPRTGDFIAPHQFLAARRYLARG